MRAFRWISTQAILPEFDLRREGWRLISSDETAETGIAVVHSPGLGSNGWLRLLATYREEVRRPMLVCGVDGAAERAAVLGLGFGDVIGAQLSREEYLARASRLADLTFWLPRRRSIGPLQLDLLARDAFCGGTALTLKALEFGLLWRLSDVPGEAVSRAALIQDVWRLGFIPATNSLAVHMSRLRARLGDAGLAHIIQTTPGGYRLHLPDDEPGTTRRDLELPLMTFLAALEQRAH